MIYGYEDGAAASFAVGKRVGIKCAYDLPIGYWKRYREIVGEELQRSPLWSRTISVVQEPAWKLERKDQELELADTIIVASTFTKETLSLSGVVQSSNVHLISYGAPACSRRSGQNRKGPIRLLFAGVLNQRKGIGYLAEALGRAGINYELTLIGQADVLTPELAQLLSANRWIKSLPHSALLSEMERHDVFVFPSLFEGFGLVILEAMSRGLVVITTPHTCGPDVIEDGLDGFIVPIRSSDAIATRLALLDQQRDLLAEMGTRALAKAAAMPWDRYESGLVKALKDEIGPPGCRGERA